MKRIIIGRASDCDYVIQNSTVSRRHAEIKVSNRQVSVRDLESSNGTYVNGEKISDRTRLEPGDELQLGANPVDWTEIVDAEELFADTSNQQDRDVITIGRAPDNDVTYDFPNVSRNHAELYKTSDGQWKLRDLDSTYGTFLGDLDNEVTGEVPVNRSDQVYFATYKTTVDKIISRFQEEKEVVTKVQSRASEEKITIGRDSENTQQVDNPLVSREHAVIYKENQKWYIKDLNSTNGTWVEGEEITSKPVQLKDRSVISVGPVQIIFRPDTGELITERPGEIRIDVMQACREVPDMFGPGRARLVDDVSLSVYPGEMVGILGPSGAGKSEMMKMMCRYTSPSSGNILFNGLDIQRHYGSFRQKIGYVPQDEIIHPELKVEEALEYSARLRLPPDTTSSEIEEAVTETLDTLGLLEHRDKIIGSPETGKILSGGQRKRVNMGIELIARPSVLFLDEPTSGLSIKDSEVVMKHLRKLADNGTTVVQILHSPPAFLYRLLDQVTWLVPGGRIAYYGPPDPGSYEFFDTEENMPGMIEKRIAESKPKQLRKDYEESKYHKKYVQERQADVETKTEKSSHEKRPSFNLQKFLIYMERYFKIKQRDKWNFAASLILPVLITVALAILFGGDVTEGSPINYSSVLFFLSISSLWLGCSASAQEIVSERTVFKREKMVNLRVIPYISSKLVVLGGFAAVQTLLLMIGPLGATEVAAGEHFFIVFAILMLTNLTGISLGLLISSMVRTPALAATLVPLVLIPCVIFAGLAPPLADVNELGNMLAHFIPSRYSFGALLAIEGEFYELPAQFAQYENLADFMGFTIETEAGEGGWITGVFALLGFITTFVVVTVSNLKKVGGE